MVVGLAGQQFERKSRGFRSRSMSRFLGGSEGHDRIEALPLESFAVELGFTAGRGEVARCEGEKGRCSFCRAALGLDGRVARPHTVRPHTVRGGKIQADAMLIFQTVARYPLEPRVG